MVITLFASLVQDYLIAHGHLAEGSAGRMIALMGDAELDEGNIYKALIEGTLKDFVARSSDLGSSCVSRFPTPLERREV